MQNASPRPVAFTRPSEPPMRTSLPVTTLRRSCRSRSPSVYWRRSHAITSAFVPTSGAGMSMFGPMSPFSRYMNRSVMLSSSSLLYSRGSMRSPPFAPPNGTSAIAVFHVISAASALNRSRLTALWNRSPPLYGPRAWLCCTRYPLSRTKPPGSIR